MIALLLSVAAAQLPAPQHRALMDLYASVGCPSQLCTRFPATAVCPLDDSAVLGCGLSGNVLRLSLNDRALSGSMPSTFAAFTALTALRLSNNNLTGRLDSSIGLLSRLEILDLAHNAIEGRLPSELALLTALTFLTADHNQLSGAVDLTGPFSVCNLQTALANETNCLSCGTAPLSCLCRGGLSLRCSTMTVSSRAAASTAPTVAAVPTTTAATTLATLATATTIPSSTSQIASAAATSFAPSAPSPSSLSLAPASLTPHHINWGLWGGVIGGVVGFLLLLAVAIALFVRSRRAPQTAGYAAPPQQVQQEYAAGNLTL